MNRNSAARGAEVERERLRARSGGVMWRYGVIASALLVAACAPTQQSEPKYPTVGRIDRRDPALDEIIESTAKIEKHADGFTWSEGPRSEERRVGKAQN